MGSEVGKIEGPEEEENMIKGLRQKKIMIKLYCINFSDKEKGDKILTAGFLLPSAICEHSSSYLNHSLPSNILFSLEISATTRLMH